MVSSDWGAFAYSLAPGACLGFGNAPLDELWGVSASSPGVCCQPQAQAQLSVDGHLPLVSLLALKGKRAAWLGWVTVVVCVPLTGALLTWPLTLCFRSHSAGARVCGRVSVVPTGSWALQEAPW